MSTASVDIQLSPIPSTSSSSIGTVTSPQTSSVTSNSTGYPGTNLQSNTPSTTTNNTASSITGGTPGSAPQPWLRPPWRKIQRACISLAKLLIAMAGVIVTYLALSTAMWSSAKDYRDDCRSLNVSVMCSVGDRSDSRLPRKPTGTSRTPVPES